MVPEPVVIVGDARRMTKVPDASVHCVITSPPYWALRRYPHPEQIGAEPVHDCAAWALGKPPCGGCYVCAMREVAAEVHRVLRPDGTFFLNIGDTMRDKNLLGIPHRVAIALKADGWHWRSENIWQKTNAMAESARDRPSRSHEVVNVFTKSDLYFWDWFAVRTSTAGGEESGRDLRTVWDIPVVPYNQSIGGLSHFAAFPPALPRLCISAGTSELGCCPNCAAPWQRLVNRERRATRPGADSKTTGVSDAKVKGNRDPERHVTVFSHRGWAPGCKCVEGWEPGKLVLPEQRAARPDMAPVACTVLDPFGGTGTTARVAWEMGRRGIVVELAPEYVPLIRQRLRGTKRRKRRPADPEPLFANLKD